MGFLSTRSRPEHVSGATTRWRPGRVSSDTHTLARRREEIVDSKYMYEQSKLWRPPPRAARGERWLTTSGEVTLGVLGWVFLGNLGAELV